MIATNELRFVEREVPGFHNRTIRVLQQKWATERISRADQYGHSDYSLGEPIEWRDVPCVKEGE